MDREQAKLTDTDRDAITRKMRDCALRVAEQPFIVSLKAPSGRGKYLSGEVVQFYTHMSPPVMIAGLCDEVLRLRAALREIARNNVGTLVTVAAFAQDTLDRGGGAGAT